MSERDEAELLRDVADRAAAYRALARGRAVRPDSEALADLARFDVPLPEEGLAAGDVIEELDRCAGPGTMATAGGRFFGFVVGGSLPVSVAASWLSTAWDQNAGMRVLAPSVAALEDAAGRWLRELFGLPAATCCSFTTGTTTADMVALVAAREALYARLGWDVTRRGMRGAPGLQVVVGDEVHTSLLRALAVVGFGHDEVVRVPVDGQGRMRADALPDLRQPSIVCLQAGNVNTGACDPLAEITAAAREGSAWVHVDGAFGMWAAASGRHRHLTAGLERADSWATDGHKWLNVPYDSGVAFVRDREALARALRIRGAYLAQETDNPFDFTLESSRRGRGVEIWAALRHLGRAGVAELVERCCAHARRFAAGLEAMGFEVLNEVVLNQVLVSFGDDRTNAEVIRRLQEDGTCWCGGTQWQGRSAMRISVSSWSTSAADVERSLAAMERIARDAPRRSAR